MLNKVKIFLIFQIVKERLQFYLYVGLDYLISLFVLSLISVVAAMLPFAVFMTAKQFFSGIEGEFLEDLFAPTMTVLVGLIDKHIIDGRIILWTFFWSMISGVVLILSSVTINFNGPDPSRLNQFLVLICFFWYYKRPLKLGRKKPWNSFV